jgi:hypothetical protein
MSLELAKTFLERALSRRDNITAKIRQAGSFATQQCRVLDISRKSARLKVADSDNIPDSFLFITFKRRSRVPRIGNVASRHRGRRGVERQVSTSQVTARGKA